MSNHPDPDLERRFAERLRRDLDAGLPALDPTQAARIALQQHGFHASRMLLGVATVLVAAALTYGALRLVGPAAPGTSTGSPTPADGPVTLQTQAPGSHQVCGDVRIGGVLTPDPSYGLGVLGQDGAVHGVVWPNGYSAQRQAGVIILLDPPGQIVARQGDEVVMGGVIHGNGVNYPCDPPELQVQPPPIRAGSAVTGTGYLIESTSGRVQLCIGGSRLMGPPGCSVVAVRVDGVSWDKVPGATQSHGIWYAQDVTVHGTWTGTSVTVRSVTAAPPNPTPDLPRSCAAHQGDGTGLGTMQEETALRPLNDEVFGHPDRYGGMWRAASADGLGRIVVDVVGDPASVASKLHALYPYPLCVIRAQFSEADLEAALRAIGLSTPDWVAEVDYPPNRVTVWVAIFTENIRERLAPYGDRILLKQLLQPG